MAFKKKSKFSSNQRTAYNSGKGYAVAYEGKKIEFKSSDLKESFMAGFRAGRSAVQKSPKKYPNNPNIKRK